MYAVFFVFPRRFVRWNNAGLARERSGSSEFVLKRSVRIEVNVLIRVGRLSVNVKGEAAVGLPVDVDVKHVNVSILLFLLRPLYVRVNAVDECK